VRKPRKYEKKDPRLNPQPEKGPAPAEVMDLTPFAIQTPAYKYFWKPPHWKKNFRSLNVSIGDLKWCRPHF